MPAGLTMPLIFLGRRIGWPPLSRMKATSGCDSNTRSRRLEPLAHQRVDLADFREDAEGLDRHAARRIGRAHGDFARPPMRRVPRLDRRERRGFGIDGSARRDRKDARLALPEQRANQRFRAAAAVPRKIRQADRHVDGDDRFIGKSVEQPGKSSRTPERTARRRRVARPRSSRRGSRRRRRPCPGDMARPACPCRDG